MTPQERGRMPAKDPRYPRGGRGKQARFMCHLCDRMRPTAGRVFAGICWRHRRSA